MMHRIQLKRDVSVCNAFISEGGAVYSLLPIG